MKRILLAACLLAVTQFAAHAQSVKSTEDIEQVWLGYFNQTRFSNKWGSWTDLHVRTKERFFDNYSQAIIRLGLTYYIDNTTKITAGYARIFLFPGDNHKGITQPEHRPWQQLQWHTNFKKTRLMQWVRLEERFRRKIANDSTLADGYNFNWRLRYNILYEVPLINNGNAPKSFSFVVNDELHINFGKEIVNNYFDQNRFFVGFKYQVSKTTNLQFGYMNLFQQLSAGNRYKNINAARIFLFQNFDLRKKPA
ncbi:MAG TPA: DUF2490 domain-containing protein [Chitinophagaceae bacterium]|nr:DUF2490 domain-containing protein [Chitinophagaceae bacterium]